MDALAVELVGEPVRADARRDEHQHLLDVARLHEVHQKLALALARHRVNDVRDQLGGRVLRRDLHRDRVAQERLCERPDVVGERGREQEALLAGSEQREDALDVRDEPHVEHPVGFVEDEDLDLAQGDRALLHVVEQPAGCRDQDLDALSQRLDLGIHRHAAEDLHAPQRNVLAVLADAFLDLRRELARRRKDQRADRMAGGRDARVRVRREQLQKRQREPRGLAGAGLRAAHDVAAGEHMRNRLHLDRRGRRVTLLLDGSEQLRAQAQVSERGQTAVLRNTEEADGRRGSRRMKTGG